ncbi:GNAT family N-acetyltransferase [uncultured Psychroserpens sp.]|uniref:GNAT family N-acetyltransferase n=1 Tax=uncultured Psychroserpens sp. TaxID=255436 RepID=UPI002605BB69|nr:GNAT family N-acetyltransferase [uncultured Psychroserpens sp.]
MIILETDRLELRTLNYNDVTLLYPILSDEKTMAFYPSTYNIEKVTRWINKSINSYRTNGFGLWAVILKETNTFIGQCGISLQDINGNIVPEIGYQIDKHYWNKGYAAEAAFGCLKYGFQTLKLDELFIHTYIKNKPSQRVAEKIGMSKNFVYEKQLKTFDVIWEHVVYSIKNN